MFRGSETTTAGARLTSGPARGFSIAATSRWLLPVVHRVCAPARLRGGIRPAVAALLACAAVNAAAATSSVRVRVADLRLTHAGELRVELQSADGRPHRVALHVTHDLGGLRPLPATVDVPQAGGVHVDVRVFRGDAAWGSRHEVDVVALEGDAPVGLASAVIDVAPDPALVPRVRPLLIALGLLLLAVAVVQEWRRETAP